MDHIAEVSSPIRAQGACTDVLKHKHKRGGEEFIWASVHARVCGLAGASKPHQTRIQLDPKIQSLYLLSRRRL